MARPLRIQYENACYHVTCRGNARQDIFLDEGDRKKFLECAARSLDIYQVQLLCFVLMNNHFHLIVKTPKANLQEFMRHFNISYTAFFNTRHGRSGHLYQGRYKAFLIDADSYLLQVSRYLHLNPIHTKEMESPDDETKREYLRNYRWSSYPDYVSSSRYPFLSPTDILDQFQSKAAYRVFVEEGLNIIDRPLERGKGHGIVGSDDFIGKIMEQAEIALERERPQTRRVISHVEPERVLQAVSRQFRTTQDEIMKSRHQGPARSVAMDMLYRHAHMNQREIGELMGVDYSTVSVGRKRLYEAMAADPRLKEQMAAVEVALYQG
jgi:putative transposase